MKLLTITWFLWATVWPVGVNYYEKDIKTQQVGQFTSKDKCDKALAAYRLEVRKMDRPESRFVELICSPIYPR